MATYLDEEKKKKLATPSFMELSGSQRNAAMGLPPEIEQVGPQGFTLGPRSMSGADIAQAKNADLVASLVNQARKPSIIETEHGGWDELGNVIKTPKVAPGSILSGQAARETLRSLGHGVTASPTDTSKDLAAIQATRVGADIDAMNAETARMNAGTDAAYKGIVGQATKQQATLESKLADYYLNPATPAAPTPAPVVARPNPAVALAEQKKKEHAAKIRSYYAPLLEDEEEYGYTPRFDYGF